VHRFNGNSVEGAEEKCIDLLGNSLLHESTRDGNDVANVIATVTYPPFGCSLIGLRQSSFDTREVLSML
jgi:hypothetical protein